MLDDKCTSAAAEDDAKNESHEDGVVELPRDGDEVGDQVEGHDEVGDEGQEQEPAPAGHAPVGDQPTKQDDAVRDEARKRGGVTAPPRNDEAHDEDGVERRGERDGEQPAIAWRT